MASPMGSGVAVLAPIAALANVVVWHAVVNTVRTQGLRVPTIVDVRLRKGRGGRNISSCDDATISGGSKLRNGMASRKRNRDLRHLDQVVV